MVGWCAVKVVSVAMRLQRRCRGRVGVGVDFVLLLFSVTFLSSVVYGSRQLLTSLPTVLDMQFFPLEFLLVLFDGTLASILTFGSKSLQSRATLSPHTEQTAAKYCGSLPNLFHSPPHTQLLGWRKVDHVSFICSPCLHTVSTCDL